MFAHKYGKRKPELPEHAVLHLIESPHASQESTHTDHFLYTLVPSYCPQIAGDVNTFDNMATGWELVLATQHSRWVLIQSELFLLFHPLIVIQEAFLC